MLLPTLTIQYILLSYPEVCMRTPLLSTQELHTKAKIIYTRVKWAYYSSILKNLDTEKISTSPAIHKKTHYNCYNPINNSPHNSNIKNSTDCFQDWEMHGYIPLCGNIIVHQKE